MVNGKIIGWMEMVNLNGLMEEYIKGNIKMIKKKDMEFLFGLAEENIKDIGKKGNKMVKGKYIILKTINGVNICLKMVKKFLKFFLF